MEYKRAKGVYDLLPETCATQEPWKGIHLWHFIEEKIRTFAALFGFEEIRTPAFEMSELFKRVVGDETDIVSKEMYTFEDRAGRSLSLRPEGTASAMRAFIENKLYDSPLGTYKYYYIGSMWRYERQQAGRYREHRQFGVEAIGSSSPYLDVEVISLLYQFLESIGIKNMVLNINSIGDEKTRTHFKQGLCDFLRPHLPHLSTDSQRRFEKNPLRILDSKDPQDIILLEGHPELKNFLSQEEMDRFEKVCHLLQEQQIPYTYAPKLVRGLDYYNSTVFEITAQDLGAQNSLGGGGRYDGLLKQLNGPALPAFGFGAGLERILQTALAQHCVLPKRARLALYMIALDPKSLEFVSHLAHDLRKKGICVEIELTEKKLSHAMRHADLKNARYVAVVGERELASKRLALKEMETGEVKECLVTDVHTIVAH